MYFILTFARLICGFDMLFISDIACAHDISMHILASRIVSARYVLTAIYLYNGKIQSLLNNYNVAKSRTSQSKYATEGGETSKVSVTYMYAYSNFSGIHERWKQQVNISKYPQWVLNGSDSVLTVWRSVLIVLGTHNDSKVTNQSKIQGGPEGGIVENSTPPPFLT